MAKIKPSLTFGGGNDQRQRYPISFPIFSLSSFLIALVFFSGLSSIFVGVTRQRQPGYSYAPHPVPASTVTFPNADGGSESIKTGNIRAVKKDENDIAGDDGKIRSLKDLTPEELHPHAGPHRHLVDPPPDNDPSHPLTLVECQTTKGPLHIAVHPTWAPLGAAHFLDMVESEYFSSKVALMRCIRGFLCQFGLPGDPTLNKKYRKGIPDDPNWLPEGPDHRKNEAGVKRFAKGYLAYAGGGKNSRGNQLIVALKDNERLAGGSPWEVPWGELVGKASYETLDKIYTGYGEKGPSQGRLSKEGSSEAVAKDFPMLDYVTSCTVLDSA